MVQLVLVFRDLVNSSNDTLLSRLTVVPIFPPSEGSASILKALTLGSNAYAEPSRLVAYTTVQGLNEMG